MNKNPNRLIEYPILCPNCKRGYMKLEYHKLYPNKDNYLWVCEYCRFCLNEDFDNPSRRNSRRKQNAIY
jgi:hypothetical protein